MANDMEKLERYLRELTKWAEKVTESLAALEERTGGGTGGGRGPGRPPPPPDLGGEA